MNNLVEKELIRVLVDNDDLLKEINWIGLSTHPLSEDFIKEFQDYVDWQEISQHSTLSDDFINEFKDKLDLELMLYLNIITLKFHNKLIQ